MAALQHMINFAPPNHSKPCKEGVKKRNRQGVKVYGTLSEQNSRGNDGIKQVKDSPFKRSLLRGMPEPSPIEKAENEIMDYCSTLEGDEGYNCWEAYFEFEDMKKEAMEEAEDGSESAKEDLVRLVRQSGGVKDIVENVHFETKITKMSKGEEVVVTKHPTVISHNLEEEEKRRPFPEPDGLPKSQKELEEEEKALMPDSSYTRMFRRLARGQSPAWYTPRPDHETD